MSEKARILAPRLAGRKEPIKRKLSRASQRRLKLSTDQKRSWTTLRQASDIRQAKSSRRPDQGSRYTGDLREHECTDGYSDAGPWKTRTIRCRNDGSTLAGLPWPYLWPIRPASKLQRRKARVIRLSATAVFMTVTTLHRLTMTATDCSSVGCLSLCIVQLPTECVRCHARYTKENLIARN